MNYTDIIDRYYPAGTLRRDIYLRHCRSVADLALEIAGRKCPDLDRAEVEAAAMLHDIGIFLTDAPDIGCTGKEPYLAHGVLGAQLLRSIGAPETWARVAERHTGTGITSQEILSRSLPLPPGDYMPESELERLVCYADKFYSKSGTMERKPREKVRASLARISEDAAERFDALEKEFGIIY
ncbi:MAG: HDIG domain-containing protein [Lachnoclostridium sp.]|nr:HDIG domain-containing protein [Lachnoclostridium sp.]